MKLAEALIVRSDTQKRFEQLKARILANAKVQEGDTPSEDPSSLLVQMEQLASTLLSLISRINKTNSLTAFDESRSLADALAERDIIMLRRNIYSELAKAASVAQARTTRSEVKFKSTISVVVVQTSVDELSKSYRELDSVVQGLNWKVDLMD